MDNVSRCSRYRDQGLDPPESKRMSGSGVQQGRDLGQNPAQWAWATFPAEADFGNEPSLVSGHMVYKLSTSRTYSIVAVKVIFSI